MSNSVTVDIVVNASDANAEFKKLEGNAEKSAKVVVNSFDKMDMALASFAGNLAADAFHAVLSGAKSLFNFIGSEGIKAAEAQEDAINKMNIALKSTGEFTDTASREMNLFSAALQENSKYGDEVILNNMALIQSLGSLSGEGLKQATQAALDLSAALSIDLETASRLVGKAAEGNISAFSKFGLTIQKGADDAETFANTLTAINSKFEGAAAGAVNTYSGSMAQLGNTIGDLQEKFGEIIIKNPAVLSAIKILNDGFKLLQIAVEENKSKIEPLITLIGVSFGNAAKGFFDATSLMITGLGNLSKFIVENQWVFDLFESVLSKMTGRALTFFKVLNEFRADDEPTPITKTTNDLLYLQSTIDSFPKDKLKSLFDFAPEQSKAVSPLLPPEQLEQALANEQFAIDKANQERLAKQLAFEESLKSVKESARLAEEQILATQRELDKALLEENNLAEIEFLSLHLEQLELVRMDAQIKELTARGLHEEALALMRDKAILEDKMAYDKASKAKIKTRDEIAKEELDNRKKTFDAIASLQNSSNKELAAAGKAFAIYNATINTIEGVTKAIGGSGIPFPANIAAGVLVGAAGAVQIAKIAGASFAEGGIVPGNSFYGDRIPANVNSGEMILNRQQQSNLFDQINNGSRGSSTVINVQGNIIADDESQIQSLIQRINDSVEFNNAYLLTGA